MKLLEYQAHDVMRQYGIPAPEGYVAASRADLEEIAGKVTFPVAIKAQVQTGNRGKLGGIKFAETAEELVERGTSILGMTIKDLTADLVFVTSKVDVAREMYLSFTMDRTKKLGVMIFSAVGGVDINEIVEANPDAIATAPVPPGEPVPDFLLQYAVDKTGVDPALAGTLKDVFAKLGNAFVSHDCLLAEINPLVVDASGAVLALDGKIEVDDNALYRHQDVAEYRDRFTANDLVREARAYDFLYIPVRDDGTIAVVSNGSGMIMSSIDLITKRGMEVTCALDLGGGATSDRIKEALRIVSENPRVETIFINIFGGITRCDEIAHGIAGAYAAMEEKRLVVRLEGTNRELGLEIVRGIGGRIELVDGLYEGVERLGGEA